jgi:hypothetical protein
MFFDLGIGTIIATVVGCFVLAYFRDMEFGGIVALGFVGLLAGLLLAVLPSIHGIGVGLGEGRSLNLNLQDVVNQVKTKAAEVQNDAADVRDLKEQMQALLKRIQVSEGNVAQTEQNLLQMQTTLKQATRALVELNFYEIASRNFLGMPPPIIITEINGRLLALEGFAYDNDTQKQEAFSRINSIIAEAQIPPPPPPPPSRPPTPTASPSPTPVH